MKLFTKLDTENAAQTADLNPSFKVASAPDLTKRGIYRCSTLDELVVSQPPDLVEGLLPHQSVNLLVGDSGLGKTPLALTLAVSVASGQPFVGRKVQSGPVLYCDAETSPLQFRRMLGQVSSGMGLSEPPADVLAWSPNWRSDSDQHYELFEQVYVVKPLLVIVDPLRMFFPFAEQKAPDAEAMVKKMRTCGKELGCSFLIIHHRRKPNPNGTPLLETDPLAWLQEAAGSYALINHTDARLGVEPPMGLQSSIDLILCGLVRSMGAIPPVYLSRVRDENGDPVGYEALLGMALLNPNYQNAFMSLSDKFRWSEARAALGNSDSNTSAFLAQCLSLQVVKKKGRDYVKSME